MRPLRLLTALLLTLGAAQGHAQESPDSILGVADRLYYSERPAESLSLLKSRLAASPGDTAILWRAARAALAIGWLEPDEPVSIRSYLEADSLARAALRADPDAIMARYIHAATLGRRALIAKTPRAAALLADSVHDLATGLLRLQPHHAGAFSMLGQLHAEVMRKPWAVRTLGLRLGGGIDFDASWSEAERLLRMAVELEPQMMLHSFELARVYVGTKRHALAQPLLESVVAMPVVHPMDRLMAEQARTMLAKLRR